MVGSVFASACRRYFNDRLVGVLRFSCYNFIVEPRKENALA